MNNTTQLVAELEKYNEAYRAGSPIVSDEFYDIKTEELRALDPDNPYLHRVEPEPQLTKRAQVRHPVPMLSMEKAYTVAELEAFINRCRAAAGADADKIWFGVTPKLDGVAARDDGTVLATRGNGDTGYDITDAFQKGVGAVGGRGQGIGEIVLEKVYFAANLAEQFEHPRNVVVGVVMSDELNPEFEDAVRSTAIHFVPYVTLQEVLYDGAYLLEVIEGIFDACIAGCPYPTDGIVISVTTEDPQLRASLRAAMGSTGHHNRWQIAYKRKGEMAETTVEKIVWQVGRTGKITPVLEVAPVKLSGATIRRVTAHNALNIVQQCIGVGSRVLIVRSGEVIPKIERVLTWVDSVVPTVCPECGQPTSMDDLTATFLMCTNEACPAKNHGQVSHWFKTIGNVNLFGPKALDKLLAEGYNNVPAILGMGKDEFMGCGFSDKQSDNLVFELDKCRRLQIDDWRVLASLGIQYLGRGDSKHLCKQFTLSDIIRGVTVEQIKAVDGFADKTANSIVAGIEQNRLTLVYLLGFFENIRQSKVCEERSVAQQENKQANNLFAGKRFVFTGSMSKPRDEMQAIVEEQGGVAQGSVNKSTDYLVIGEKVGAAKTSKAASLGVKVITEAEFWALAL